MNNIDSKLKFLTIYRSCSDDAQKINLLISTGSKKFENFFKNLSFEFELFFDLIKLLITNIGEDCHSDLASILKFIFENKRNKLNFKMIQKKEKRFLLEALKKGDEQLFEVYQNYLK